MRAANRHPEAVMLAVGCCYLVLVAALALWSAWPIYEHPQVLLVVLGGLVAVLSIVGLFRFTKLTRYLVIPAAVAAYVLISVPLAVPAATTGSLERLLHGLVDALLGVVLGWRQLLTLTPPLGDYQAVLVPLLVTILVGGLAVGMLATSARRIGAFAVLPATLMIGFGVAFGPQTVTGTLVFGQFVLPVPRLVAIGIGFALLSFTWLTLRVFLRRRFASQRAEASAGSIRPTPTPPLVRARRVGVITGILVVALGVSVLTAPALAAVNDRQVLREGVEPQQLVAAAPSPLSSYRSWFSAERFDLPLFTVSGAVDAAARLRIATLDDYDGNTFKVSANDRYLRQTNRGTRGSEPGALTVVIGAGYSDIWVPLPVGNDTAPRFFGPRAEALTDSFYAAEQQPTAIALGVGGTASGLREGDSYVVNFVPGQQDQVDLLARATGRGQLIDALEYPQLATWVDNQEVPRDGSGLLTLVQRLRERGFLSHSLLQDEDAGRWIAQLRGFGEYVYAPSYAGHYTARIEELFGQLNAQELVAAAGADTSLVAAIGDDEQFAVATALLARYLGIDSRVVLGVRLGSSWGQTVPEACSFECSGQNLTAWVEVLAGSVWVPIDVTPQFLTPPAGVDRSEQLPENPTVPEQPSVESLDPPSAQADAEDTTNTAPDDDAGLLAGALPVLLIALASLAGLVLLMLPLFMIMAVKRLRARGRRRAETAELRLLGAWEELLDRYADSGRRASTVGTRSMIANELATAAASNLAALVDEAVFAPQEPDSKLVAAGWQLVDGEKQQFASQATLFSRIRSALSLASLLRPFHTSRPRSEGLEG